MSNKHSQEGPWPIGLVIVTHAEFGQVLFATAQTILGPQDHVATVSIGANVDMNALLEEIRTAAASVDQGSGVLVLTDMFGGTPTNLSLSILAEGKVEVLTGVNLPMVIKSLTTRLQPLDKAAKESRTAGISGIVLASEILTGRGE